MGWLGRLMRATPKEDLGGIRIDTHQPFWEVDGKTDFPRLLRALSGFLPDGSILYFEDGSPRKDLLAFLDAHAIPEQTHVAAGALWPEPVCYHVPATEQNLARLAELTEHCAEPELAIHFHVYHEDKVLVEWHDAFSQPMLLDGSLAEDKVSGFVEALSMKATRRNEQE